MALITLPELPKGKEFEEYIAAYFNSTGFYVDRNLVLREDAESITVEILELDIHVTDYRQSPPKMTLVELKSGGWGMPDVFKIKGWMELLNLESGLFITLTQPQDLVPNQQVANRLGITLVPISDHTKTPVLLEPHLGVSQVDFRDVATWRFSYWLEQTMIENLKHKKKCHKTFKRYEALDQYLFEVNNGTFFCPTIAEKVERLYDAFRTNPKITAKCAHEMQGDSFDEDYDTCPKDLFDKTFYDAKYTDLQLSTYVEHRARLAILKAAVDVCLYKQAGVLHKVDRAVDVLGLLVPMEVLLPANFVASIPRIQKEPYFHLYPVFWQWFLWVFGGFILKDHEEKEYKLLSQKSGIPVEHLPAAFDFYNILFPISGGWFLDLKKNVRVMKMFPVPFRGIGANYRRLHYCPKGSFAELQLTNVYASQDISNWNNLACEVLRKSSRYKEPKQENALEPSPPEVPEDDIPF